MIQDGYFTKQYLIKNIKNFILLQRILTIVKEFKILRNSFFISNYIDQICSHIQNIMVYCSDWIILCILFFLIWHIGTSVCNGDSGGGMVFIRNHRWYLRGIVSLTVAKDGLRVCDTKHYVVFTDVAKYTDFITRNLQ